VLSAGGTAESDALLDNCMHLLCFMSLVVIIICRGVFSSAPSRKYLSASSLGFIFVSVFTDTCLYFARIVFGHQGILKK
jgi:hypothetical protein